MATDASDWGDSLNPHRWGVKRLTIVVMFVGYIVLDDDPNIVLLKFPPYKTYGAKVVRSHPIKVFDIDIEDLLRSPIPYDF